MASTASLRSRRSAAQRHALAGVEREIRANDPNGRRKYLQDFSEAFRSYKAVIGQARVNELLEHDGYREAAEGVAETMRALPPVESALELFSRTAGSAVR